MPAHDGDREQYGGQKRRKHGAENRRRAPVSPETLAESAEIRFNDSTV